MSYSTCLCRNSLCYIFCDFKAELKSPHYPMESLEYVAQETIFSNFHASQKCRIIHGDKLQHLYHILMIAKEDPGAPYVCSTVVMILNHVCMDTCTRVCKEMRTMKIRIIVPSQHNTDSTLINAVYW